MKRNLFISVLSAMIAPLFLAGCGSANTSSGTSVNTGGNVLVSTPGNSSSSSTASENSSSAGENSSTAGENSSSVSENSSTVSENSSSASGNSSTSSENSSIASENSSSANESSSSGTEDNFPSNGENDLPVVYMTSEISADGLVNIYNALGASPSGKIAVKLSTGEPGSNYLRTDLIGDLVKSFNDPTIVECNTAYGGSRSNTAMHYQVAKDHGYTDIANVDIMDENGSMTLPVTGGDNLTENYVGENFANYDYFVVLSHFKGHAMAGFGGAIKNISIGIASSEGKAHIHSGGTGGSMWSGEQDAFLESVAEAGKSVVDYLHGTLYQRNEPLVR